MHRGFTVKIYPNKAQEELLGKNFGCCRWVYNHMLVISQKKYHRTGKTLSGRDMQYYLPKLKKQYPWLAEAGSQSLQIVCHNLADAYNRFFKGLAKYPKFRKKGSRGSFTCINNSRINETHVRIPKIGEIRYRGGDIPNGIAKRFVINERAGKYYCSILFEIPQKKPSPLPIDNILGIDLGITDMVVTSQGLSVKSTRPMKEAKSKLQAASKAYSRTEIGSNRRKKAKQKLKLLHEKVANQRKDFNHKLSRMFVDKGDNQAFAVEDLNIKGMMSNHKLAFHISDMGWHQFLTFLEYKAAAVGKHVIKVDRYFPSSKTCSVCGLVLESLPLNIREWTCECGSIHHRDINAAINIAYEAARNSVSKRGDQVTPSILMAPINEARSPA